MKNFFLIVTFLFSLLSQAQNVENLVKDKDFLNLLSIYNKELSIKVDTKLINQINSDKKLEENELTDLSLALGYKDLESFKNELSKKIKLIQLLEERYKISNFTSDELLTAFERGNDVLGYNSSSVEERGRNCWRKYRNCILAAGSAAVTGHIACGAADLTVLGGILCHGAVILAQAAVNDNCLADYEECIS